MKKSTSKILVILLLSLLLFFFAFFLSIKITKDKQNNIEKFQNNILNPVIIPSPTSVTMREKAKVIYVYDGDTIELSDKRKVRYIGIDAPEVNWKSGNPQCFATESAKINTELVSRQEIEISKDISDTDKYGRLLRYVWVDGVFLNDFLLRQGYAKLELVPPDTNFSKQFIEAQNEARHNNRGLWGKCKK